MRWSLDIHKYISETTRKALQIIVRHKLNSASTEEAIKAAEMNLVDEGIYKNYESAKGRVRRALFTYFKAYGCLDGNEELTEVGKLYNDNILSIQEFCFYYIVNYEYVDESARYYPIELILRYLSKLDMRSSDLAYLKPYDFSKLVLCNSVDEITDELIDEILENRDNPSNIIDERKIGFDIWMKMLFNAGILEKYDNKSYKMKNKELADWILSAYEQGFDETKRGTSYRGILRNIPTIGIGTVTDIENTENISRSLQAFLFDGVNETVINKYISEHHDLLFEKVIRMLGLTLTDCGYYRIFAGIEKIVAISLLNSNDLNIKKIGEILLSSKKVTDIVEDSEDNNASNILLYGVPGCGKSHTIKTEYCNDFSRMERVVFHPEYTYTDFIGQILPFSDGERITYEFTPGPFTRLLKKAYNNSTEHYFLVIEEINRGNAAAIFGEVFQLLDRDLLGRSEYSITNYDIAKAVYENDSAPVFLPSNLSIIATMNTSDQNVFTLDTAFQRRWQMRLIENDIYMASHANEIILDTGMTWGKFATIINNLILENTAGISSSEDKRLGAYFVSSLDLKINEDEFKDIDLSLINRAKRDNSRFPEKVLKYLWDDAFKFSREIIFDTQQGSLEILLKTFKSKRGKERLIIFSQGIFENR